MFELDLLLLFMLTCGVSFMESNSSIDSVGSWRNIFNIGLLVEMFRSCSFSPSGKSSRYLCSTGLNPPKKRNPFTARCFSLKELTSITSLCLFLFVHLKKNLFCHHWCEAKLLRGNLNNHMLYLVLGWIWLIQEDTEIWDTYS